MKFEESVIRRIPLFLIRSKLQLAIFKQMQLLLEPKFILFGHTFEQPMQQFSNFIAASSPYLICNIIMANSNCQLNSVFQIKMILCHEVLLYSIALC